MCSVVRHSQGCELCTDGARQASEMAARSVQCHGHLDLAHYVEVTDERGESVARVRFGEAVAITEGDRAHAWANGPNLDQ